jgi:hypothetical protein
MVFFIFLEVVLQAARLATSSREGPAALAHPGAPVILCVGDSHTYGYLLPPQDSYPARLQARLDRRGLSASVVNAGVPGMNSSQMRRRLPELLARYHPALVIIQSGSNNDWNRRDTVWSDLADGSATPGPGAWLARAQYLVGDRLRTVKLFSYLWNRGLRRPLPKEVDRDREGKVFFHEYRGKPEAGSWDSVAVVSDRTRRDLGAMVKLAQAAGARVLFINYVGQPVGDMGLANERNRLSHPDLTENHLAGPGNELVAENVEEAIIVNGLLAPPAAAP